ncbi:MAG TPA: hypothetical protein VHJ78_09805, partial [Actinomycetota bacterium]|nr:hypothetical protein [Actinomycetota bacterium]
GRAPGPFWIAATCGADAPASSTRTRLLQALMKGRGTSLEAVPLAGRGSNRLASLAGADALMEVPAGAPLARGSGCRILWLRSD